MGGVSQFIVDDSTGKITGYKTKAGADTVFPFSSGYSNAIAFHFRGVWGSNHIISTNMNYKINDVESSCYITSYPHVNTYEGIGVAISTSLLSIDIGNKSGIAVKQNISANNIEFISFENTVKIPIDTSAEKRTSIVILF